MHSEQKRHVATKGDIILTLRNNIKQLINDVLWCESVMDTIISPPQLAKKDYVVLSDKNGGKLLHQEHKINELPFENVAYVLHESTTFSEKEVVIRLNQTKESCQSCQKAQQDNEEAKLLNDSLKVNKDQTAQDEHETLIHYQFGHTSIPKLKRICFQLDPNRLFCVGCASGKLVAKSYSKHIDPLISTGLVASKFF